jgi:hypothetical protein
MGFDVIYDAEKEVAALIDPERGRALGPLISAGEDRAKELIELFVAGVTTALGKDISDIHPVDLAEHFRQFIGALVERDDDEVSPDEAAALAAATDPNGAAAARAVQEPAALNEAGGLAGPTASNDVAREAGAPAAEDAPDGPVADGGLPTGVEQAREAEDPTVNAAQLEADPQGTAEQPEQAQPEAGAGIPKA